MYVLRISIRELPFFRYNDFEAVLREISLDSSVNFIYPN